MRLLPLFLMAGCMPILTAEPSPPPAALSLSVGPLVAGASTPVTVTGAEPGTTVYLARASAMGRGPCFPSLDGGCLSLRNPVLTASTMVDRFGMAELELVLPTSAPGGLTVHFQAATTSPSAGLSDVVTGTTRTDGDADQDGFVDAAIGGTDCDDTDPSTYPLAEDPPGDGIDSDCDGVDRVAWSKLFPGQNRACGLVQSGEVLCWGIEQSGAYYFLPDGLYVDLDMGTYGICAITDTGRLACAGDEVDEPLTTTLPLVEVAYRDFLGCVLDSAGTPYCWDRTRLNPAIAPVDTFAEIVVGQGHACGLRADGTVGCWGDPATAPSGTFVKLEAGRDHTCGLTTDDRIECWGDDRFGQLTPPAAVTAWTDVAANVYISCGLDTLGDIHCWGNPLYSGGTPSGRFSRIEGGGDGMCAFDERGLPTCWGEPRHATDIPPGLELRGPSHIGAFTCGLDGDDSLRCFGENTFLQTPPSGPFERVELSSYSHACAVDASDALTCWGNDDQGQLALSGQRVLDVAVGQRNTCVVRPSGRMACVGDDAYGQSSPPTGDDYLQVSVDGPHSCAVRRNGLVDCWGVNHIGQATPPAGERFTEVRVGGRRTCGLRRNGDVSCWGFQGQGQSTPPAGTFVELTVATTSACAATAAGEVSCWGEWNGGEGPSQPVRQIHVQGGSACGNTLDGQLLCWGSPRRDPIPTVPVP